MGPHLDLQEKSGQQSGRMRKNLLRGRARAFVPIFFVVGGTFAPTDLVRVFSELADLPMVTTTEEIRTFVDRGHFVSRETDLKQDADFVRCRWQLDRILMTSLGKGTTGPSVAACAQTEGGDADSISWVENRGIQEKVVSLTSDGYPLSAMAGSIATYDPHIAGLIVGIAKKESDWGKRTPKLHGEECFNYWGYRGYGSRGMTEDGYGCFAEPADAVHTIGNRLIELSSTRGTTDPERMVVWKCGSSCATHSPESVRKWISDVELYYQQFAGAF